MMSQIFRHLVASAVGKRANVLTESGIPAFSRASSEVTMELRFLNEARAPAKRGCCSDSPPNRRQRSWRVPFDDEAGGSLLTCVEPDPLALVLHEECAVRRETRFRPPVVIRERLAGHPVPVHPTGTRALQAEENAFLKHSNLH